MVVKADRLYDKIHQRRWPRQQRKMAQDPQGSRVEQRVQRASTAFLKMVSPRLQQQRLAVLQCRFSVWFEPCPELGQECQKYVGEACYCSRIEVNFQAARSDSFSLCNPLQNNNCLRRAPHQAPGVPPPRYPQPTCKMIKHCLQIASSGSTNRCRSRTKATNGKINNNKWRKQALPLRDKIGQGPREWDTSVPDEVLILPCRKKLRLSDYGAP